ncbi:hypothetical protein ABB37_00967 [Leptomonas pyrrhocoris]|uniref:Uncharacterized protein n=1 Tax=Leptomonas pyrrhocoris TaxID=157538 RepID=A0A0M9GBD6_LEPPY|nr:hypothetical protein ABB37_00967 [Leptomonas pyrrhocoris]KPA86940.1 hypothetical protein ABB37_00967 [Leptomonas pyrrhocoris]|eukprot:XP_015665379.1 hypothetical protein ABB37_00967 [Leptomonas pyrrhocoris]
MGTRSSRPARNEPPHSNSSTPLYLASPCSTQPSTIAGKDAPSSECTESWGGSTHHHHHRRPPSSGLDDLPTLAKDETAAREQKGNYFSNDYKRQLAQRKAAMRYAKTQHTAQPPSSLTPESALSSHLGKEDVSPVAASQVGVALSDDTVGGYDHRSTAPSVVSDASVRTVAHKPLPRQDGSSKWTPTARWKAKKDSASSRRLRRSDEGADSTRDERRRDLDSGGFFPFLLFDASYANCSGWGWGLDGGDDCGGGWDGGDANCLI